MTCPAQALFDELHRTIGERSRPALERIHALCLEERQRPNPVLTVAHIGRLSSKGGGPSTATLRNRSADYGALIHAHAAAARRPKAPAASEDERLKGIRDPELRAWMGAAMAEARSLRKQLLAARHVANRAAQTPATPVAASAGVLSKGAASESPLASLLGVERRALKDALSPSRLEHFGWFEDAEGRVVDDCGLPVFPAGFASALRKLTADST
ncbi:MAG: hypothetical protein AMXMBFR59_12720 [Rhodanobacteraceae bacterium]